MRKRRKFSGPMAAEAERFLPLTPRAFAILAVLAEGAQPGVEILERLEGLGTRILGPGTLYRLLRELRQQGLIERTAPPAADAVDDDRRQYHALSRLGAAVFEAEAQRLRRTLALAGPSAASRRRS